MLPQSSGLEETTLDEPVAETLKREFRGIANKVYKVNRLQILDSPDLVLFCSTLRIFVALHQVILPSSDSKSELRNCKFFSASLHIFTRSSVCEAAYQCFAFL